MPTMKIKKQFALTWAFEPFENDFSFFSKRMFGCLAAYFDEKMVMVLAEGEEAEWNGVLYPTEREHHADLQKEFPSLVPHPVLPKWLYLPMTALDFEEVAAATAQHISENDVRFGILPKPKKKILRSKARTLQRPLK